ncbi:unnamed protein product [Amoebophrya sp. A120]|nr:unnamed protein product [Amoebophrya sp. A120]|eukprot:GSA120T00017284001.1
MFLRAVFFRAFLALGLFFSKALDDEGTVFISSAAVTTPPPPEQRSSPSLLDTETEVVEKEQKYYDQPLPSFDPSGREASDVNLTDFRLFNPYCHPLNRTTRRYEVRRVSLDAPRVLDVVAAYSKFGSVEPKGNDLPAPPNDAGRMHEQVDQAARQEGLPASASRNNNRPATTRSRKKLIRRVLGFPHPAHSGFGDRVGMFISLAALAKTLSTTETRQMRGTTSSADEHGAGSESSPRLLKIQYDYKILTFWPAGGRNDNWGHNFRQDGSTWPIFRPDRFFTLLRSLPKQLILLRSRAEFLRVWDALDTIVRRLEMKDDETGAATSSARASAASSRAEPEGSVISVKGKERKKVEIVHYASTTPGARIAAAAGGRNSKPQDGHSNTKGSPSSSSTSGTPNKMNKSTFPASALFKNLRESCCGIFSDEEMAELGKDDEVPMFEQQKIVTRLNGGEGATLYLPTAAKAAAANADAQADAAALLSTSNDRKKNPKSHKVEIVASSTTASVGLLPELAVGHMMELQDQIMMRTGKGKITENKKKASKIDSSNDVVIIPSQHDQLFADIPEKNEFDVSIEYVVVPLDDFVMSSQIEHGMWVQPEPTSFLFKLLFPGLNTDLFVQNYYELAPLVQFQAPSARIIYPSAVPPPSYGKADHLPARADEDDEKAAVLVSTQSQTGRLQTLTQYENRADMRTDVDEAGAAPSFTTSLNNRPYLALYLRRGEKQYHSSMREGLLFHHLKQLLVVEAPVFAKKFAWVVIGDTPSVVGRYVRFLKSSCNVTIAVSRDELELEYEQQASTSSEDHHHAETPKYSSTKAQDNIGHSTTTTSPARPSESSESLVDFLQRAFLSETSELLGDEDPDQQSPRRGTTVSVTSPAKSTTSSLFRLPFSRDHETINNMPADLQKNFTALYSDFSLLTRAAGIVMHTARGDGWSSFPAVAAMIGARRAGRSSPIPIFNLYLVGNTYTYFPAAVKVHARDQRREPYDRKDLRNSWAIGYTHDPSRYDIYKSINCGRGVPNMYFLITSHRFVEEVLGLQPSACTHCEE